MLGTPASSFRDAPFDDRNSSFFISPAPGFFNSMATSPAFCEIEEADQIQPASHILENWNETL